MNCGQYISNICTAFSFLVVVGVQGQPRQSQPKNSTHGSIADMMRLLDPEYHLTSPSRLRGHGSLLPSCDSDNFKLCASLDSKIQLQCLVDHADQLSSACKKAFENSVPVLCRAEIARHCDVSHTIEESVIHCLEDHLEELPNPCSDAVIATQDLINHRLGARSDAHYKTEGAGMFCGHDEIYRSNRDDAGTCKAKCTEDPTCLGFTTYSNSHCDSCLHYSHDCSLKYMHETTCTGDIQSYTKVFPLISDTQRQLLLCTSLLVVLLLMWRKRITRNVQNGEKMPLLPAKRDLPSEAQPMPWSL